MTVGFQAFNDAGKLQFDTNSSAFSLVGSGTVTAADVWFLPGVGFVHGYDPTSGVPGVYYDGTYALDIPTLPANTEIVAFMNDGGHWGTPSFYTTSGGSKRVTYTTQPCTINVGGVPRSDIDEHILNYYAFTSMRNLTPAAHGVGLQLFNTDGSLAWDSNLKPLLVTGSGNYAAANYPTPIAVSGSAPGAILPLDSFFARSRKSGIEYLIGMKGNSICEYPFRNDGISGNLALTNPLSGAYRFIGVSSLSLS